MLTQLHQPPTQLILSVVVVFKKTLLNIRAINGDSWVNLQKREERMGRSHLEMKQ